MSTAIALPKKALEDLANVESIAAACSLNVLGSQGHFTRALTLAAGIKALRQAITPQMMTEIMSLQCTSLGFRTDKDKEGGYDPETVKECAIEAALRGAYWCGNEFNIIAGRAYMTKEFFTRVVREFPGLTDLKLFPGVPKMIGDSGALVPYSVTWKLNGVQARIDRGENKLADGTLLDERICVRVNKGMGADAILGKAERKVLAAVYKQLTGSDVSDGEAEQTDRRPLPSRSDGLDALTQRLTGAPSNGNGATSHAPEGAKTQVDDNDDSNFDENGEHKDNATDQVGTDEDSDLRADAEKKDRLDALAEELQAASTGNRLGAVNEIIEREIASKFWGETELKTLDTWADAARKAISGRRGQGSKQKALAGT